MLDNHDAQRALLEDDAHRVIAWYRDALAQLPASGEFDAVDGVLVPQARKLSGLRMEVGVHPFRTQAGEWIATLEFRIAAASGGSSIAQSQGLGTRDEILAQLAREAPHERIVALLDRGGEEIWRGGADLQLDERVAAVRAGTHAPAPHGKDCEELAPGRLRWGGVTERLFDMDDISIALAQCDDCGQRFVCEFLKVWGDRWTFWTRVSDEEAELIRTDFGWAPAILLARQRVTVPPAGKAAYWDEGHDTVLAMGPRS